VSLSDVREEKVGFLHPECEFGVFEVFFGDTFFLYDGGGNMANVEGILVTDKADGFWICSSPGKLDSPISHSFCFRNEFCIQILFL